MIEGGVAKSLRLSLNDLQTGFATQSIVAVLQCAGNHRADPAEVRPSWASPGRQERLAMSAGRAVRFADVLRAAGAAGRCGRRRWICRRENMNEGENMN
jgi:sulfite oxidase